MDQIRMQRYINIIIIVCISIVPLVIFPFGEHNDYFYEPKAFMLTILSTIFLFVIIKNQQRLNVIFQTDRINFYLFLYFFIVSLSLFFAIDLSLAIQGRPYRVDGYSTMLVYFILFFAARSSNLTIKKLTKPILITATILSIYGILQYFGIDPFPRDFTRANWKLTFATFGNPNFMGSYLVMMIPFAIHLYIKEQKRVAAIVYAILLFCLLCTSTRGTWIGAFIAFCSYFVFSFLFKTRFKIMLHRYILLLLLTIVIIFTFNQFSDGFFMQRFNSISNEAIEVLSNGDKSDIGGGYRIYIWKKVVELIREKPFFGYGIENLAEPFVEKYGFEMIEKYGYVIFVDKAHNEYLHISVTTGIPSLLAYIFFIFQVFKKGVTRLPISSKYWPVVASLMGYFTQAFFNISVVSVAYIFWVFLGLASNYHEDVEIVLQGYRSE